MLIGRRVRAGVFRLALARGVGESKLLFHRRNKKIVAAKTQDNLCGANNFQADLQAYPSLFGITLRAQPRNAAIAVHPVINIGLVF